jgi:hypothetical protein
MTTVPGAPSAPFRRGDPFPPFPAIEAFAAWVDAQPGPTLGITNSVRHAPIAAFLRAQGYADPCAAVVSWNPEFGAPGAPPTHRDHEMPRWAVRLGSLCQRGLGRQVPIPIDRVRVVLAEVRAGRIDD